MEKKNLSAEMAAASAEAARVVGNVPQNSLDAPTPCGDWDLRTLLNHTILWTSYSAERRAHGESVAEDLMNKDFTADPGFREDYARQIGKAVQAWSAPRPGPAHETSWATPPRLPTWARCCSWRRPCTAGTWPGPPVRSSGQTSKRPQPWRTSSRLRPNSSASTRASPTPSNHRRTRRSSSAPSPCPAATPAGSRRHNDAVSTRTGEP